MASIIKSSVARAAAILTNSAVGASSFLATKAADGNLAVQIDFTKGSLTNGIFTPQVSPDNSTWYDVTTPGALTLTADGTKQLVFPVGGFKFARVTVTGTGTLTSSSATVTYRWIDKLGV